MHAYMISPKQTVKPKTAAAADVEACTLWPANCTKLPVLHIAHHDALPQGTGCITREAAEVPAVQRLVWEHGRVLKDPVMAPACERGVGDRAVADT